MDTSEAVFVSIDDWEGLYIDGTLAYEEQSIDLHQAILYGLEGVTAYFEVLEFDKSDEAYVKEYGSFPLLLDELLAWRKM